MAVSVKIISGNGQPNGGVGFVGMAGCKGLTSSEKLGSNNVLSPFPPLLPSQVDESIAVINARLNGRFNDINYYSGSGALS
mgnify:FL=1|tara:strand:- start:1683 stop:1925 length:243 start_codon:yes stop_codon:yes gene_type:complete